MMKLFLALGFLLLFPVVVCYGGQVTIAWNPNSEDDLEGYKVYYGNSSGIYDNSVDVGSQVNYTIMGLSEGDGIYIAATAYDFSGNESDYSSELFYSVPVTEPESLDVTGLVGEAVDTESPDQVENLRR